MNELKADVYKQDTLAGHFFSTPHTTEFRYSADKYEVTALRLAQAKKLFSILDRNLGCILPQPPSYYVRCFTKQRGLLKGRRAFLLTLLAVSS